MAERSLSVVQMLPALESGGVERGTLEVADELVRQGHRSIVISGGGRLVSQLTAGGSEHISWPVGRKSLASLLLINRLRQFFRNESVDIIHVRSRMPAWLGWLAWRGMDAAHRPRFVTTVHGLYSVNAYSRIMTRGEQVIAVSDTVHKYILDNYPDVDPQRIKTIYRGVDREEFSYGYKPDEAWLKTWYTDYPFLRGKRVLTLPGRLTRLKGHGDFIELIGALDEKGLPVHGLIVGHLDPQRQKYIDELKRDIARRGLMDMITFTGQRSDIKNIYAVSDIVLSLSKKPESFGRTVLEALCMGVPVVGYDHGGVGEILGKLYQEGLVSLRDIGALSVRVCQLIESEIIVPEFSAYSLETMLDATIRCYVK